MSLLQRVCSIAGDAGGELVCAGPAQPTRHPARAPPAAPPASRRRCRHRCRTPQPPGGNRVFGVLPNYRTADTSQIGTVLTNRQKLTIAAKDSFDYPLVALAAALAGLGQLTNQHPSFGQGLKGYGHRWSTSYADQAMGNMFTEGLFPVLLHEDPRYFRRGTGTTWSRLGYALSARDRDPKGLGGQRLQLLGVAGKRTAVAISNAYYPDNRNLADNTTRLLQQVGIDAVSRCLRSSGPTSGAKCSTNDADRASAANVRFDPLPSSKLN